MRSCALGAVALVALAAGCEHGGGAVSVRWRVVDLAVGANYDPANSSITSVDGACCPSHDFGICNGGNPWVVRRVGIELRDPVTGGIVENTGTVPCTTGERTTVFNLPSGSFAIGLTADVVDAAGQPAPVALPPPEVHTIVSGDVVNLQVIEIGVNPLPQPTLVPLPGPT